MNSKEYCKKFIDEITKQNIEDLTKPGIRHNLVNEYNIELRETKGYHGREILELIQNADDAYEKSINLGQKPNEDLEVKIIYNKSILIIENSGTVFDEAGIRAIVYGNDSTKPANEFIGNKGTGFRSTLNWAKRIVIKSGYFNIEFSKEIANKIFEDIKDEEQIKKQIQEQLLKTNTPLHIPMLLLPKFIEDNDYYEKTRIEITLDENKLKNDISDVENQINRIDKYILLFLPNVTKISIDLNGTTNIYEREKYNTNENIFHNITDKNYSIILKTQTESNISEKYFVYEREIKKFITDEDKNSKSFSSIIVLPENDEYINKSLNLYTFFPLLSTEAPFNCIMHGTYELSSQRNSLIKSNDNKKILLAQLEHLLHVATSLFNDKKDNKAIDLIIPKTFNNKYFEFSQGFKEFNLELEYVNLLKNFKMLRNVNSNMISLNEKPDLLLSEIPAIIKGECFNNLVSLNGDDRFNKFIKCILNDNSKYYFGFDNKIDESKLKESINSFSNFWTVQDQVKCYDWWENNHFNTCLPNLLKDKHGNWLKFHDKCYLLEGKFDEIEIFEWVDVPSLDSTYQSELIKLCHSNPKVRNQEEISKDSIIRIICNNSLKIYSDVEFSPRDNSTIIQSINSSINNDYNHAIDFVKWLWKYHGKDLDWSPQDNIKFNFPTKDGKVVSSKKIHFNNEISNNLFGDDYSCFPTFDMFDISIDDYENFENFILKFGVLKFPLIDKLDIKLNDSNRKYILDIIKQTQYKFENKNIYNISLDGLYISGIDNILERLSTSEIIKWIVNDTKLFKILKLENYNDTDYDISFRAGNYRNSQYYDKKKAVINFLLDAFNNSHWIEINGSRYSPNEILLDLSPNKNNEWKLYLPVLSMKNVTDISRTLNFEHYQIIEILKLFNFCESPTDLKSDLFYKLLLQLEEKDDVKLTKKIYQQIDSYSFNKTYSESTSKHKFFEVGKVLTKTHGFQIAKDVFVPSTKIINKKNTYIIDKNPRTDNKRFMEIFGCKEYNENPVVDYMTLEFNPISNEFEIQFKEFKKIINQFGEYNKKVKDTLPYLNIYLIKNVIIDINGQKMSPDENLELKKSDKEWYIVYNKETIDINSLSKNIRNVFSNIANSSGFDKYAEYIRELFTKSSDIDEQRKLIIDWLGSCEFDNIYLNDCKENFIETMKMYNEDFQIEENINFNNLDSIETLEYIYNVFNRYNILSLTEFKNKGFSYDLNFTEVYNRKIVKIINREAQNYKNYLYESALSNDKLKDTFIKDFYKFKDYLFDDKVDNFINPLDVLINKFGDWRKTTIDCELKYSEYYKLLNPNKLSEDNIDNNDEVKQYIYFNLKDKFELWLKKINNKESNNSNQLDDPYEQFRHKIPKQENLNYKETKEKQFKALTRKHKSYNEHQSQEADRRKKYNGNCGELLIYNLLVDKFGRNNVFPKSEAFVQLGIIEHGQGISEKCDIEYIDPKTNERYFVEVKTGDCNSFFITPDELEFAMQEEEKYKLFVVYDIEYDSKYIEIDSKFWTNSRYRRKDIIEKIKFDF